MFTYDSDGIRDKRNFEFIYEVCVMLKKKNQYGIKQEVAKIKLYFGRNKRTQAKEAYFYYLVKKRMIFYKKAFIVVVPFRINYPGKNYIDIYIFFI